MTRAELLVSAGLAIGAVDLTVAEAVERWPEQVKAHGQGKSGAISSNTYVGYRSIARNQIPERIDGVPDIANMPVRLLTPALIDDWSSQIAMLKALASPGERSAF